MKVIINSESLIFHDVQHPAVNEFIAQHELKTVVKGGKLHVYGKRNELYGLLLHVTKDYDVDLI